MRIHKHFGVHDSQITGFSFNIKRFSFSSEYLKITRSYVLWNSKVFKKS
ncbi:hypothetical protein GYH30_005916 [Glycine max]|uniref:Uncharacterized protein n=1 Tax=Glycine max TaxID=3847 RepID=A0A0R0KDI6_SOYBN|nr:hypothetical protein GYH30_005916 [Glycine max]